MFQKGVRCVVETASGTKPANMKKAIDYLKSILPTKPKDYKATVDADLKKCQPAFKACKGAKEDADGETCEKLKTCLEEYAKVMMFENNLKIKISKKSKKTSQNSPFCRPFATEYKKSSFANNSLPPTCDKNLNFPPINQFLILYSMSSDEFCCIFNLTMQTTWKFHLKNIF